MLPLIQLSLQDVSRVDPIFSPMFSHRENEALKVKSTFLRPLRASYWQNKIIHSDLLGGFPI